MDKIIDFSKYRKANITKVKDYIQSIDDPNTVMNDLGTDLLTLNNCDFTLEYPSNWRVTLRDEISAYLEEILKIQKCFKQKRKTSIKTQSWTNEPEEKVAQLKIVEGEDSLEIIVYRENLPYETNLEQWAYEKRGLFDTLLLCQEIKSSDFEHIKTKYDEAMQYSFLDKEKRILNTYFVKNQTLYTISYNARENIYPIFLNQVERVINSFKIKKNVKVGVTL